MIIKIRVKFFCLQPAIRNTCKKGCLLPGGDVFENIIALSKKRFVWKNTQANYIKILLLLKGNIILFIYTKLIKKFDL